EGNSRELHRRESTYGLFRVSTSRRHFCAWKMALAPRCETPQLVKCRFFQLGTRNPSSLARSHGSSLTSRFPATAALTLCRIAARPGAGVTQQSSRRKQTLARETCERELGIARVVRCARGVEDELAAGPALRRVR